MLKEDREDLSVFIGMSITTGMQRIYDAHWELWKSFVRVRTVSGDPFLGAVSEAEKTALVTLFMYRRYQAGAREKAATAVTAGVRMHFVRNF